MTTTYTSYQLITRDIDRSIERVSQQPLVGRETEYYLSRIGEINSVDEFMADTRIYNYAMKAFGLEDMAYAKAFMRKVLTEGADKDDAFANQLSDAKYKQFAETFNFARYGESATVFTRAQQGTVDKYFRQTLEEEAGADNTGVRLALYFERSMPTIADKYENVKDEETALRQIVYNILGDEALYQVVRTALALPPEIAGTDVDKQADLLIDRLALEDFADPEKFQKFLQRFTIMWELENPTYSATSALLLSSSGGFGISADLMMSINNLKLGGR